MQIDVIIPVYKPDKTLVTLVERLEHQTVPVQNIILMNTEEKYFGQLAEIPRLLETYHNIQLYHLSRREFDHGGTRRRGVGKSHADIFVMMTQDAIPADSFLVEKLCNALKEDVAVAYARQLPREECNEAERFTRSFNYPAQSCVKRLEDLPRLGIKTYFCSNVCAAYRRECYEELGGFVRHTIFNEDMLYAAKAVHAGYAVAYAAEAQVIHSHNYSNSQQFHRNFDLGVSQADHQEIFQGISSESEGKKMILMTTKHLWKKKMFLKIFHLYIQTICKYAGYLLGKNYVRLPRKWVMKLTDNKAYWQQ